MSLKMDYYKHILGEKIETDPARAAAFNIVHDFTDRRGLRQEWEQIDDDIQEEIIQIWIDIIKKAYEDNPLKGTVYIKHEGVQFGFEDDISCSGCGFDFDNANRHISNYCPNCGCKIVPKP